MITAYRAQSLRNAQNYQCEEKTQVSGNHGRRGNNFCGLYHLFRMASQPSNIEAGRTSMPWRNAHVVTLCCFWNRNTPNHNMHLFSVMLEIVLIRSRIPQLRGF